MKRRVFLGGAATVIATGLAGCMDTASSDPENLDYDVGMGASYFLVPGAENRDGVPTVTVGVGDTVVWENTGSRGHTVTAYESSLPDGGAYFASGGFDSEQAARNGWIDGGKGTLFADETYEHTFDVPGSYEYFCVPHERGGMVGRVVVE